MRNQSTSNNKSASFVNVESGSLKHNNELSKIFKQMADCYYYLGKSERFRAHAYEVASDTIRNMSEPIDKFNHNFKELDELHGVGKSIAEKIVEYLDTGKIKAFEELKKHIPFDLFDLMNNNNGIGPSTIRLLHDSMHVDSKKQLIEKIKIGELRNIKGIKEKKIENISKALNIFQNQKNRFDWSFANEIAIIILKKIKVIQGVVDASIAGSLRRKKQTIGDIDIVVSAPKNCHHLIINTFVNLPDVKRVLLKGSTKASVILNQGDIQLDFRVVNEDEYGAALLYFTGSKEHNISLRKLARKKGLKINEYGVFDLKSRQKLAGEKEEDVYKILGLTFISPELREGKSEIK